MATAITLAAPHPAVYPASFLPGSVSRELSFDVRYTRLYSDLLTDGAPNTDHAVLRSFPGVMKEFPKPKYASGRKKVLLVTFPGFIMSRKVGKWIEEQELVPMDWHTMLSLSDTYPRLVKDLELKKIRLVSLAHPFRHPSEWHVCTVHQECVGDNVTRAMVYEPVKGGWNSDHFIGFMI